MTNNLLTAEQLRMLAREYLFPLEDGFTHERIGRKLNLTAGFIGMVLSGARAPSKAFLDAIGFERVILYRKKAEPTTAPQRLERLQALVTDEMVKAAADAIGQFEKPDRTFPPWKVIARAALEAALSGSPQVEAGALQDVLNDLASIEEGSAASDWMAEDNDRMVAAAGVVAMPKEPPEAATELSSYINGEWSRRNYAAIHAALKALGSPVTRPREQEGGEAPVAWGWMWKGDDAFYKDFLYRNPANDPPGEDGWTVTPLFAHPAPLPADGWKDMASAPLDGTEILLFSIPDEVPELKPHIGPGYWKNGWRFRHSVGPSFKPAHWMSLPTPPASTEGGADA